MVELEQEFALPAGSVRLRAWGDTSLGNVRRINEDSLLLSTPLFAVADGMGGHALGDRASQAAVAALGRAVEEKAPASPAAVLEAIEAANAAVRAVASDADGAMSGTTLTGIAFVDLGSAETPHWMTFNVGDSRTYSWDGRSLRQITVDHSAVQELIDRGELSPAQALRHPHRNVVTRALGADDEVEADVWLVPARGRQTFILCSDGLTKELPDDEIARIITYHFAQQPGEETMDLAARLTAAAVAAGGSDNVTVLVVESEFAEVAGAGLADDTLERGSLTPSLEDTRPRR